MLTKLFVKRIVSVMATSTVLLGLLAPGALHGYDLKREFDSKLPAAKPLAFGQVYATLGRLVRDGLVVEESIERAGGPDRTTYAVTSEGRSVLWQWMTAVEPPVPFVAGELFAKVVVILLLGDEHQALQFLETQRAAHLARMRECTAVKTDPQARTVDVVAADLILAHLDADLKWMQTTMDRVSQLRLEVHR